MWPGSAKNRDLGDWMDVKDEREGGVKVSGLNKILIMEIDMDNRDRTDLGEGTDISISFHHLLFRYAVLALAAFKIFPVRREFSVPLYYGMHFLDYVVNFLFCILHIEAESQRSVSRFYRNSHSGKYMGRIERLAGAGASR